MRRLPAILLCLSALAGCATVRHDAAAPGRWSRFLG